MHLRRDIHLRVGLHGVRHLLLVRVLHLYVILHRQRVDLLVVQSLLKDIGIVSVAATLLDCPDLDISSA